MRVAISTDGGYVSAHFGRCPSFTIVDIDDGKMTAREEVENPGHHPGSLPKFLHEKGVNCIVAGGMGQNAMNIFAGQNIETMVGVSGTVKEVVDKILGGTLSSGESLCKPGGGKGYGLDKSVCDHSENDH
jgi:predicted Fe-Mo cluster-binding NifX family protein